MRPCTTPAGKSIVYVAVAVVSRPPAAWTGVAALSVATAPTGVPNAIPQASAAIQRPCTPLF